MKRVYYSLSYAVSINFVETLIYLSTPQAPFLTPTFTFLGCNFQKYQGEEKPTRQEIKEVMGSLSSEALVLLEKCDIHQWAEYNWRKTPQGLRLIDYGEDPLELSWAHFIRRHFLEIIKATAPK